MKNILFLCQVLKLTQIKYTMFPTDLLASVALWIINVTSANGTLMMYYTSLFIWVHSSRTLLITQGNQNIHRFVVTNYVLGKSRAHLRCIRNEDKMLIIKWFVLIYMKENPTWLLQTKAEFHLREAIIFQCYKHPLFSFCNLVSMFIPCGVIQMDLFNFPCPTFCHRCFVLAMC